MSCNEWIDEIVKGKTFADVGGLWGTVNEKITVAAKAGASSTAMIDLTTPGSYLWEAFHKRCQEQGVSCSKSIVANVDSVDFVQEVGGKYDVVHCSGVIYHCPNPIYTISQLLKITNRYLILASTVIPSVLINSKGILKMEKGSALFVPSLNERQRRVVNYHFAKVGANEIIPSEACYLLDNDDDKYAPWWYLFTPEYVAGLLNVCNAKILDSSFEWEGRTGYFFAEKNFSIK